jgi:Zn-dependent protease with chaperone function
VYLLKKAISYLKKTWFKLWDYLKPYAIKTADFIRLNGLYIIWFSFYVLVTTLIFRPFTPFGKALALSTLIYGVTISITWLVGDEILKLIENIRPIETKKETEYLTPIFEDAYSTVKEIVPKLPHMRLHIIDNMSVNAFAIGSHTIALTQGAINTFSEEELKAIICHEIAHIYHGNTKAILMNTLGNGVITLFILAVRFVFEFLLHLEEPEERRTNGILYFILNMLYRLFSFICTCFLFVGNLVLSGNSRNAEFKADQFAFDVGYGKEMTDALYLLQKMSLSEDMRLVERIQVSHPRTSLRIARVEHMLDNEEPYYAITP